MTAPAVTTYVEERLDELAAQLREVTDELHRQRASRERWQDLFEDLAPLAEGALSSTIAHLDVDSGDVDDLFHLTHTLVRNAAVLEAWIGPLQIMSALAGELGPLGAPAVASLNARLQQLDDRGYFAFARRSAEVLDRVVTSFSEDDVTALGDNIVLILQTVKQMTQPEVMGMLRRTALTIQEEGASTATPSTRELVRQLRDPLVRRGLARALGALRSVGAETAESDAGAARDTTRAAGSTGDDEVAGSTEKVRR